MPDVRPAAPAASSVGSSSSHGKAPAVRRGGHGVGVAAPADKRRWSSPRRCWQAARDRAGACAPSLPARPLRGHSAVRGEYEHDSASARRGCVELYPCGSYDLDSRSRPAAAWTATRVVARPRGEPLDAGAAAVRPSSRSPCGCRRTRGDTAGARPNVFGPRVQRLAARWREPARSGRANAAGRSASITASYKCQLT